MAQRALGALLSIFAAIAFVVSIASSAWWAGHPTVQGHARATQHVKVGLFGATGCNTGGDGSCAHIETGKGLAAAGYLELAMLLAGVALAFLIAVSTWQLGARRKELGSIGRGVAVAVSAGAVLVLLLGPDIKASQHVSVPIGWGTFITFLGIGALGAAGTIARRLEGTAADLAASAPPAMPDVQALFDAPNVRPLYEAMPVHDTAPEEVALPQGSSAGIAVPAAPPPDAAARPPADLPPPRRAAAASAPPPIASPSARPSPRARARSVPPPSPSPRRKGPSVSGRITTPDAYEKTEVAPIGPPRAGAGKARMRTTPGPGTDPSVRALPDVPRKPEPAGRTSQSTLSHKVPPPPRAEAASRESLATAVEIDAEAKAAARAAREMPAQPEHEDTNVGMIEPRQPAAPIGDSTDTGVQLDPPLRPSDVVAAALDDTTEPPQVVTGTVRSPVPDEGDDSDPLDEDTSLTDPPEVMPRGAALSTAPTSLPPPRPSESAMAGPTPACPQCDAPMSWVEEHLRFYCKSCRMYF